MPEKSPAAALSLCVLWTTISLAYYGLAFLPSPSGILVNIACCLVAVMSVALLSSRQIMLKTYLVAFSAATWLSTLKISSMQEPLQTDFLVFLAIHLLLLAIAIGMASLVRPRSNIPAEETGYLVNLAVYAFIAIASYISITAGLRLTDFLAGEKLSGDLYRIPGLSGLQGLLSIIILCCFSYLNRFNKILFITLIILIAIIDVKRGETIRIVTFVIFYNIIINPKNSGRLFIFTLIGLFIFVVLGEARQGLYSTDFSISDVMESKINIGPLDWIYGYFGINISVLQEYFYSTSGPAGYFQTLTGLILNTGLPELEPISIRGFNAGTAFSIFAGQEIIAPSLDFLFFCLLVGMMVALSTWLGTPSLRAFMLVQIFGFVFGNQLILPYYIVGFFAAAAYQLLPGLVLEKKIGFQ